MGTLSVAKYALLTVNAFFIFEASLFLGTTVYLIAARLRDHFPEDSEFFLTPMVFLSAAVVALAATGCCGALRLSRRMLALHLVGFLCVFLPVCGLALLGTISQTETAQNMMKTKLKNWLPLSAQTRDIQEFVQEVERSSRCCGLLEGPLDWGLDAVPDSCRCEDIRSSCSLAAGRMVYSTPCVPFVMTWMSRVSPSVQRFTCLFMTLLFMGMCISAFLIWKVRAMNLPAQKI